MHVHYSNSLTNILRITKTHILNRYPSESRARSVPEQQIKVSRPNAKWGGNEATGINDCLGDATHPTTRVSTVIISPSGHQVHLGNECGIPALRILEDGMLFIAVGN